LRHGAARALTYRFLQIDCRNRLTASAVGTLRLQSNYEEAAVTVQVKTALALKEWVAVIGAMVQSRQIVALRKSGIREKAFLVAGRSLYLLPTFEHQV